MPELPEVEVIRRGLDKALPGKVISGVEVREARSFPGFSQSLLQQMTGACISNVKRRGKLLMLYLSTDAGADPETVLLIHLRMTGQLVFSGPGRQVDLDSSGGYPSQSLAKALPDKSTRVVIGFADGSSLYFNDQRKFGYLKLVPIEKLSEDRFLMGLGPEPLDAGFGWRELRQALGSGSRPVKAVLLDQHRLAGIGNIYADESLHRARIDPRRSLTSLTVADYKRLMAAIRECLEQSIADGGSTARNYVDAEGLRGEYLDLHAQVYGRGGKPCPRCGQPIVKIRLAGRGTHFCEQCAR